MRARVPPGGASRVALLGRTDLSAVTAARSAAFCGRTTAPSRFVLGRAFRPLPRCSPSDAHGEHAVVPCNTLGAIEGSAFTRGRPGVPRRSRRSMCCTPCQRRHLREVSKPLRARLAKRIEGRRGPLAAPHPSRTVVRVSKGAWERQAGACPVESSSRPSICTFPSQEQLRTLTEGQAPLLCCARLTCLINQMAAV